MLPPLQRAAQPPGQDPILNASDRFILTNEFRMQRRLWDHRGSRLHSSSKVPESCVSVPATPPRLAGRAREHGLPRMGGWATSRIKAASCCSSISLLILTLLMLTLSHSSSLESSAPWWGGISYTSKHQSIHEDCRLDQILGSLPWALFPTRPHPWSASWTCRAQFSKGSCQVGSSNSSPFPHTPLLDP